MSYCDVLIQIKKITPVLKVSIDMTTSITARPITIAAVLVIMSVSSIKTASILYVIDIKAILSVFDRETNISCHY